MNQQHQIVFDYLKDQSPWPSLYEAWAELNVDLYDGKLNPIPLIVGLSRYGKARGFCQQGVITIQPAEFEADNWKGVLAHEMAHQADTQEGLSYKAEGRVNNIHNSRTWVDRINGVMSRIGDLRFAVVYRRNKAGVMVPKASDLELMPSNLELISYDETTRWHPVLS